jgi:inner membrane protein
MVIGCPSCAASLHGARYNETATMNPITHFLTGWTLANAVPSLTRRERGIVTLACVVPDVDGLGAIPDLLTRNTLHPTEWFSLYHHQLHNLGFALFIAAAAFTLSNHRWTSGLLALLSFHIHLLEDLLGARGPDGYQWPIPYLQPFSHRLNLTWPGQWPLNAWPNFALTILLLLVTFYLAWARGYSPIEMISTRADQAFVSTLRRRLPA